MKLVIEYAGGSDGRIQSNPQHCYGEHVRCFFFRGQLAFMGNNGFTVAKRTWKGRAAANAGTLPSKNSVACVAGTLFAASYRAWLVKTGKIGSLEAGAAIDT